MGQSTISKVDYDEDTGKYTLYRKNLFKFINKVDEKDLCITLINKLRDSADKTTLTNEDIEVLYKYYNKDGSKNMPRDKFESMELKNLFPNISGDQLKISILIPMAYDWKKN